MGASAGRALAPARGRFGDVFLAVVVLAAAGVVIPVAGNVRGSVLMHVKVNEEQ